MQLNNKDIQIFLQVAFKEWCSINKKLPIEDKDWEEIRKCAKQIWKHSEISISEIAKVIK